MTIDAKTIEEARRLADDIMREPDACSPDLVSLAEHYLGLKAALQAIDDLEVLEINPSNYDHDDVCELNANASQAGVIAREALTGTALLPPRDKD